MEDVERSWTFQQTGDLCVCGCVTVCDCHRCTSAKKIEPVDTPKEQEGIRVREKNRTVGAN